MREKRKRSKAIYAYLTLPLLLFLCLTCLRISLERVGDKAYPYHAELVLASGKEGDIAIYDDFASVRDCARFDKEDRHEICLHIDRSWRRMGLAHLRSVESLEAELSAHCYAYRLGIERNRSKDAELERRGDKRRYVRLMAVAFEAIGL